MARPAPRVPKKIMPDEPDEQGYDFLGGLLSGEAASNVAEDR